MARSPKLRFRRSAAQLHALAAVERTIRATDTTGRRKYLRDFGEAFNDYRRVLLPSEVDSCVAGADVILVGDYHALPASQRYTAALVEKLAAAGRQVVLGMEAIVARDQYIVDEWQRDEIDTDELRSRIRFESDWGYDWHPFRELLQRAKAAGAKIYGLDCTPRQDMRSIRARDRHAAVKINELRMTHSNAALVVLFGESHLAPTHLPLLVRNLRQSDRVLTVLQNIDTLYWQSAGEPQDLVEAVEVCDDVLCVFSATPLEKYENYRLCIERWKQERAGKLDLAPSFYNLITTLWQFLGINPYSACSGRTQSFLVDELPEIWSIANDEQLDRLLCRRCSSVASGVRAAVKQQGSYFISDCNVFVAREFSMPWAAEEVARFVHHTCCGAAHKPSSAVDEFYLQVLECALAFFGSKVLCPSRKLFRESEVYDRYMESSEELEGWDSRKYLEMIDFFVLHKDYERNLRHYACTPELLVRGTEFDPRRRQRVIQMLGQSLGSSLYLAYVGGQIGKRRLRSLFFKDIARPGFARALYFRAAGLVHHECADDACEW